MEQITAVKDRFIRYVDQIILNKKISHAYLIEIGSESDLFYVYQFVKMIMCNTSFELLSKSNDPLISLIDHNDCPDVVRIDPDGSMIKKNQLLDLQKEFSNKSLYGSKRIYIINEADKLNTFAANTMLKFLEEPEDDIVAILLTDNRYHVIDTILSRCQILTLKDSNFNENIEENDIQLIKTILNPNDYYLNYSFILNDILIDKTVAHTKLLVVEEYIIQYLNCKYKFNDDFDSRLLDIFKDYNDEYFYKCISVIEDELSKLDFNVNYKLWLDSLFSKLIIGG